MGKKPLHNSIKKGWGNISVAGPRTNHSGNKISIVWSLSLKVLIYINIDSMKN